MRMNDERWHALKVMARELTPEDFEIMVELDRARAAEAELRQRVEDGRHLWERINHDRTKAVDRALEAEAERDLAQSQLAELVGKLPRCNTVRDCGKVATRRWWNGESHACEEHSPGPNFVDLPWAPLVRAFAAGGKDK